MRRGFIDRIRAICHSLIDDNDEEPVELRVENARMSHTRLKALKPIDPSKEDKIPVALPIDDTDPATISKRVTTLAGMSHYRLAALAATLPPESPEALESEVSPEDKEAEASRLQSKSTIPLVDDDEFVDQPELERCRARAY